MHDWYCEGIRLGWEKVRESKFVGIDGKKLPGCKCAFRRMNVLASREQRGREMAEKWVALGLDIEVAKERFLMILWLSRHGHNLIEVDFLNRVRTSGKVKLSDWMKRSCSVPEELSEWS